MPFISDYVSSVEKGLAHVGSHLEGHLESEALCLSHINNNTGSPEACKGGLRKLAITSSLMAWFADHDLVKHKQEAYAAGKIDRILYQKDPNRGLWGGTV